jgi:L-aminopeptidase/D-esterase-like protein
VDVELPRGVRVGHHTDTAAWTGCTVVLLPEGTVAAAEVRGGGPGTRESELLSPSANAPGVHAVLLTGGSAFGLGASHGVMEHLAAQGIGYPVPNGPVPLVFAAVVFDLPLGDGSVRPTADDAVAACEAAGTEVARGSVGVGTGCTVGKLLGPHAWTKGGLGAATLRVDGVTITALAAVNALGDVLAEDGSVAAGVWTGDGYTPTTDLLLRGEGLRAWGPENTTLVCLLTDASLDKRTAWLVARAGTSGVARAVAPSATAADGDLVVCAATGEVEADPFVLSALAPEVVAAAIRDGVRQATGAPDCPAAHEREAARPGRRRP